MPQSRQEACVEAAVTSNSPASICVYSGDAVDFAYPMARRFNE
jgi:hypothetical protein